MRIERKVTALTLVLVLSACDRGQQTAGVAGDTKKSVASAPLTSLDIAPQTYKRMRFVSELEQSGGGVAMKRANLPKRAGRVVSTAAKVMVPNPIVSMASHVVTTVSTFQSAAPQPAVVMASMVAPQAAAGLAMPTAEDSYIDHAGENSGGGLFGGIATHVVIRGGRAGDGKCDPRTDAKVGGLLDGRPDSRMPLIPTRSTFGGSRF